MERNCLRRIAWLLLAALLAAVLSGCAAPAAPSSPAPAVPANSAEPAPDAAEEAPFSILFLDVGQADCMLIRCGEAAMLVDGGNAEDSNLVVSVLRREGLEALDYVVCTHAHEDHVGGLAGALHQVRAETILAPVTEADNRPFTKFKEAADRQGTAITVPEPDETFSLGDASFQVLGPRRDYSETNNTSLVLMVTYGDTRFLLTGDMESDAEADLVEDGCDLRADLLKVGHHGSGTSTSYRFLREVLPAYGVIQVGKDNDYGHPQEKVLSRLRDAEVQLFRTDLQGDILASSDGTSVTVTSVRGQSAETNPTAAEPEGSFYIANVRSGKFHRDSCGSLPAEKNREYFANRSDAVAAGYEPCGQCKP